MKIEYIVPPTAQIGSYRTIGISSPMETARENALWDYNSAIEHDGLMPVSHFPKGTTSKRID